jgi:hypothetical protein
MNRLMVWIAALGITTLGMTAVHAQTMKLTSPDIAPGATIANQQVF